MNNFWKEHTMLVTAYMNTTGGRDIADMRNALQLAQRAEHDGHHAEADKQLAHARTAYARHNVRQLDIGGWALCTRHSLDNLPATLIGRVTSISWAGPDAIKIGLNVDLHDRPNQTVVLNAITSHIVRAEEPTPTEVPDSATH